MKLLKAEIVENKLTVELEGTLDQIVDILTTIKYIT
jgi:hypothetical protein